MMKKISLVFGSTVAAGFLLWACALAGGESDLAFKNAWIRALPPGMKMTAGFGQLFNAGSNVIELTEFSSPQFGDVSLHRTDMEDGVSRMREVSTLSISAGETVDLAPGGLHLMLMMPIAPLSPGHDVIVDMVAADGRVFRFELPVERR